MLVIPARIASSSMSSRSIPFDLAHPKVIGTSGNINLAIAITLATSVGEGFTFSNGVPLNGIKAMITMVVGLTLEIILKDSNSPLSSPK